MDLYTATDGYGGFKKYVTGKFARTSWNSKKKQLFSFPTGIHRG